MVRPGGLGGVWTGMAGRAGAVCLRWAAAVGVGAALIAAAVAPLETGRAAEFPYFLALKSDKVNMRVGPGRRYPIDWVYGRRGLPLLVTASFEQWRRVEDHEGAMGWVHQSLLVARHKVLVVGETRAIRSRPAAEAPAVLRAEAGVLAELGGGCETLWCPVALAGETGWIRRDALWGVDPPQR